MGCLFIGPEQDPLRDWPIKHCGAKTVEGKSYCHEHYFKVYARGTSVNGKKFTKMVDKEIEELKRLEEIENVE